MYLGGFLGQCLLTNQIGFWTVGAAGVSMWSGSQSDFGMTVMPSTRAVLYCLFVVVVFWLTNIITLAIFSVWFFKIVAFTLFPFLFLCISFFFDFFFLFFGRDMNLNLFSLSLVYICQIFWNKFINTDLFIKEIVS